MKCILQVPHLLKTLCLSRICLRHIWIWVNTRRNLPFLWTNAMYSIAQQRRSFAFAQYSGCDNKLNNFLEVFCVNQLQAFFEQLVVVSKVLYFNVVVRSHFCFGDFSSVVVFLCWRRNRFFAIMKVHKSTMNVAIVITRRDQQWFSGAIKPGSGKSQIDVVAMVNLQKSQMHDYRVVAGFLVRHTILSLEFIFQRNRIIKMNMMLWLWNTNSKRNINQQYRIIFICLWGSTWRIWKNVCEKIDVFIERTWEHCEF